MKDYIAPEFEIIYFTTADVICTSSANITSVFEEPPLETEFDFDS